MRIRIIKRLPAPLMEGFDVERFHLGGFYDVSARLAEYLILDGYAHPAPPMMNQVDGNVVARPVVLVIEDCLDVLDLYAMAIEDRVSVVKASRGETGWALACAAPPDAIVLDLMLPDVHGWDVCRRLKANPLTSSIPVIVLTGEEGADVEHQAFAEGVARVLRKPCSADRLLRTLDEVIEPSQGDKA